MFTAAITRRPAPTLGKGLTTVDLGVPQYELARQQHSTYVAHLQDLGLEVVVLEALPDYPDAHFVEDVAVMVPEVAVMTRPGAVSRQGEVAPMAAVLAAYRPLAYIEAPGTLDGGDVLLVGRHFLVGLSDRTNEAGAQQFGRIVANYGYTWTAVPIAVGLHFKSSVNTLGGNLLLVTPDFATRSELAIYERLVVRSEEAYAANTLWVNNHLMTPHGFSDTYQQLEHLGLPLIDINVSEMQKMDGGLTCMSLRF